MTSQNIADMRRDYSQRELSRSTVDSDPFRQFSLWLDEAINSEALEPTAMTLSTIGEDARPSSRVVLLKAFDRNGFVFFTNYESRKGRELAANSNATLHFFWPELERQINIRGVASRVATDESETYFKSRPVKSQIGAWASKQSTVIESRGELEKKFDEFSQKYADGDIPLPPFWGGFRIEPDRFEFWQGRRSRLHDRICYEFLDQDWRIKRLSP